MRRCNGKAQRRGIFGVAAGLALTGSVLSAPAQLPAPPATPPAPLHGLEARRQAPGEPAAAATPNPGAGLPATSYSEAGIRPEQTPEPGDRIELDVADTADGAPTAVSYRWIQVEGPRAEIEGDAERKLRVQIPGGCERLGFLRIGTAPGRVRIIHFTVPVAAGPGAVATAPQPQRTRASDAPPRADAGDDQVGLVGHRVTLNGTRSGPTGAIVYRWMQVAGPPAVGPKSEGGFFSFVPSAPGLYQFALVVGGTMAISEPDPVSVLVGAAPAGSGLAPAGSADAPAPGTATAPPASTRQIVASAAARLPEGRRVAGEMADVFEAVAGRASLYASFADLQSELARRLDVVVPAEEPARGAWSREVLQPLTQLTVQHMLDRGLDLRVPAGVSQPLTPAHQDQLRGLLLEFSGALRTTGARADAGPDESRR